jgi:hypothetical protein
VRIRASYGGQALEANLIVNPEDEVHGQSKSLPTPPPGEHFHYPILGQ